MTDVGTASRTWIRRPLSPGEWEEAVQVAGRLKAELGHLIGTLPEHARHASGMARHLGVLRVTCQRVVQAVQGEATPLMLAKLPGVEGLRQFVDGFMRLDAETDRSAAESALSAVEAFERLIAMLGGSQTKLAERLQLSVGTAAAGDSAGPRVVAGPREREELYAAATKVTGRSCDVALSVYAFRPCPGDDTLLERALAKGLIGSTVAPGGLPMVLSSGDTVHGEEEARRITLLHGETAVGRTPEAMLKPFTTDPLPMVTSRGRGGSLFQIIDSDTAHEGGPIDVVTALRARHPVMDPQTGKPTLDAVWSLVTCPSRRLILDVYLHHALERRYRPSLDALLWAATLDVAEDHKWVMRLPSQPRLQMLGRGIGGSPSPLWPRHGELTAYFYDHIGWDPDEFIGFRCEVEYPVWRAGYCMAFEYLGQP